LLLPGELGLCENGVFPSICDIFYATKLEKMFWYEAHGLYNLAFFVLGKEKALEMYSPCTAPTKPARDKKSLLS